MKRGIWIALLAVVAFAAILLARMPAAWIIPAGGAHDSCASVDGSLWSGVCTGLAVQRTPVGDVSWELHPLRLLLGKLAAHITVTRGAGNLDAEVEFGLGQRVTLRPRSVDPRQQRSGRHELHRRYAARRSWLSGGSAPTARRRDVPLDVVVAAAE